MGDRDDGGVDAHGAESQELDPPTPSSWSQSSGAAGRPPAGTGYVGSLSAAQEAALSELRRRTRERAPHPRFHDVMLLRFLRARKFDTEAAWSMFSEHLDWRESTGLDVLPDGMTSLGSPALRFPEMLEIKRCYPHGFHGLDKLGRPLYIERLGHLDLGRLLRHTSPERVAAYFAHELERLPTHRLLASSLAQGRLVEKILTVLDLDGLSVRTVSQAAARRMLQAITKVQQCHYPETMGEMIITNAPRAFHLAWKFACPMIDVGTVQKIRGLQEDPMQRLRELVEPHNLPRFLGGECECDCPGGCLSSDRGPWQDSWHSIAASPSRTGACGSVDSFASASPQHESMVDAISSSKPASPATASRGGRRSQPVQRKLSTMPEESRVSTATRSREASYKQPRLGKAENNLSSEEIAPLWQKIRRMEETYVSVLETWLAKASHLESQGSIKDMQEAQRYFDTIAVAQHAQATVHTIASQFYALMAQHAQIAMELREAETRLERLRPQDNGAPNGAFVEQALRVSELSEALRKTQAQRDNLEGEFRRGVDDFRRARGQAVDSSMVSRRSSSASSCCGCMPPVAAAGRSGAGRSGGGAHGVEPCIELQQAIAELEVDEIRHWHRPGRRLSRGLSEVTTHAGSAFTSPSSLSASVADGGSSPSPGARDDDAVEEEEAEAVRQAEEAASEPGASQAEPSEAGDSFYTCDGEASGAAAAASLSRPQIVSASLA